MKHAIAVGLLLASTVLPAAAHETDASAPWRHAVHRHAPPAIIPPGAVAQVPLPPVEVEASPAFLPRIAPYPSTSSDDVAGLSRDVDDCNKGCVDIPP